MSKSTPINQLPAPIPTQNTFVNEQQRQMITQAQQAISNSQMPQNTQMSPDILNEDDAVIQDMLNNLNSQQEPNHMANHAVLQQQQQEELLRMAAMNNMNINQLYQQSTMNAPPQIMQSSQQQMPTFLVQAKQMFGNEMKLVGIVFLAVIMAQLIPFQKYISRYIAIEKIPYHDIILKASIAAILVVIVKRLIN